VRSIGARFDSWANNDVRVRRRFRIALFRCVTLIEWGAILTTGFARFPHRQ